jgi:hypothetical protein
MNEENDFYFYTKSKHSGRHRYNLRFDYPVWAYMGDVVVDNVDKDKVLSFIRKNGPCKYAQIKQGLNYTPKTEQKLKNYLHRLSVKEDLISLNKGSGLYSIRT